MPAARQPRRESRVGFPSLSRYISRDDFSGARSRKSINVVRPSAKRTSMKPPPPMLPAEGWVTARARPTATAASTALPPVCRIATPASVAWISRETTMALRARTGVAAESGASSITTARDSARSWRMNSYGIALVSRRCTASPFKQRDAGSDTHVEGADLAVHGDLDE